MAGWNKQSGELLDRSVSDIEYRRLFNYFFSDRCRKTTTYKFAFLKAILDNIYSMSVDNQSLYLELNELFDRFAENYWNLVTRYNLKQYRECGKQSAIERALLSTVSASGQVPYTSLSYKDHNMIVNKVKEECKRYVVGALCYDFGRKLYGFDFKKSERLYFHPDAVQYMRAHKTEIEKLNYYSWAKFLEQVSENGETVKLLEKLEVSTPKREDLSIFREILKNEFESDCCFYCGKKLNKVHVDHVIPWSFMKADNLWNFVLSCPTCNTQKNDKLPSQKDLNNLRKRNIDLQTSNNEFVKKEMATYPEKLDEIYRYAQDCGYVIWMNNKTKAKSDNNAVH